MGDDQDIHANLQAASSLLTTGASVPLIGEGQVLGALTFGSVGELELLERSARERAPGWRSAGGRAETQALGECAARERGHEIGDPAIAVERRGRHRSEREGAAGQRSLEDVRPNERVDGRTCRRQPAGAVSRGVRRRQSTRRRPRRRRGGGAGRIAQVVHHRAQDRRRTRRGVVVHHSGSAEPAGGRRGLDPRRHHRAAPRGNGGAAQPAGAGPRLARLDGRRDDGLARPPAQSTADRHHGQRAGGATHARRPGARRRRDPRDPATTSSTTIAARATSSSGCGDSCARGSWRWLTSI